MRPHDRRVVSNFVVQALQGKPLTVFGEGNQTRGSSYAPEVELEEGSGVAVQINRKKVIHDEN